MTTKDFFEKQSDLTASKLEIYEKYVGTYIMKLLMSFWYCFIADLFCWTGKNWSADWSPLLLIEQAKKMLDSAVLKQRFSNPKMWLLFNDENEDNIKKLIEEIKNKQVPKNLNIIPPQKKSFKDILNDVKNELKNTSVPKFFFLDPFKYTSTEIEDIQVLMNLAYTEVFLFLPVFDAYRFADMKEKMPPKLKKFLESFTTRWVANYVDIYEFCNSIRDKLKSFLWLKYVNYALLDWWSRKNCVFLLTKNIHGIMLFNRIVFSKSIDWQTVTKRRNNLAIWLFDKETLTKSDPRIDIFEKKLKEKLQENPMDNTEIIEFTVIEWLLPKHADDVLLKLKKAGKISIDYYTDKHTGLYISENNHDQRLSKITFNK